MTIAPSETAMQDRSAPRSFDPREGMGDAGDYGRSERGAPAPAQDLHHPDVPPSPVPTRSDDRVVNENGTYSQAHWRDEHLTARERASRLRDCAQHEAEELGAQIAHLQRCREGWLGQVRAHELTLQALHETSEQLERIDAEQRKRTADDEGASGRGRF